MVEEIARVAGAGLAATWVLDRTNDAMRSVEDERVHEREAQLEDYSGPGQVAKRIYGLVGRDASRAEIIALARAVHLAVGLTNAAAYVVIGRRVPAIRWGFGALYGLALTPLNTALVPALGLTPPTKAFPPETRLRSIAYHLTYGITLELTCRALRVFKAASSD